jgi:hypothetical protein
MSVRPIALNSQNRLVAAAFVLGALSLAVPAKAQTIEEFYRKTPVQLLIGFPIANATTPMAARSPAILAGTSPATRPSSR